MKRRQLLRLLCPPAFLRIHEPGALKVRPSQRTPIGGAPTPPTPPRTVPATPTFGIGFKPR
jgi:hypothetical protein